MEGLLNERLELQTSRSPVNQKSESAVNKDNEARRKTTSSEILMEIDLEGQEMGDSVLTSVQNEEAGKECRLISFFIWVVKSLALRGFSDLDKWIDKVIRKRCRWDHVKLIKACGSGESRVQLGKY